MLKNIKTINTFNRIAIPVIISFFFLVPPAFAAAPDGNGPWADSAISFSQGIMKNGAAVPVLRSNPSSALGIAENNTVEGNFYSLGFGGNIVLGFENGISSGVIIIEATQPNYPLEKAKIEVSENGTTWIKAGEVSQDGSVAKPAGVSCAKFVRVTDISNPADYPDAIADGYDVDGVQATGKPCPPKSDDSCTPDKHYKESKNKSRDDNYTHKDNSNSSMKKDKDLRKNATSSQSKKAR